jgi:hypothetical protein
MGKDLGVDQNLTEFAKKKPMPKSLKIFINKKN